MTDKQKGIFAIVASVVLLSIGVVLSVMAYKIKLQSPFDYVKKLGAIESTTFPGSLEYSGYRFFTNNRVARLSDGIKGTYNKTEIVFDNGTKIQLSTIFK